MAAPLLQSIGAVAVSANAKCCKKPAASEQSNVMRKVVAVMSLMTVAGCQLYFREGEPNLDGRLDAATTIACVGSTNRTQSITVAAEADAAVHDSSPLGLLPRLPVADKTIQLLRFPVPASHIKSFELQLSVLQMDSVSGPVQCTLQAPLKAKLYLRVMTPMWSEAAVASATSGLAPWDIVSLEAALVSRPMITFEVNNTTLVKVGVGVNDYSQILTEYIAKYGYSDQALALMITADAVTTPGAFGSREKPLCDAVAPPKITAEVCY